MATIHLTKGGFEKRVASMDSISGEWKFLGSRPALIDFYASWCGPCKALSPIIDDLAEEFDGKVDIYKVNVDDEQELARAFGIRSIPTLLFIPLVGEPKKAMGAMPQNALREVLNNMIKQ